MYNDDLYIYAQNNGIVVDAMKIPKNKSLSLCLCGRDFIAIDQKAMENSAEERTHLAHELGHCATGSFYALKASRIVRKKAENTAIRWAVKKLIPKQQMLELLKKGYEKWDLAEYFNVTEDLIETAYHFYFEVS